MKTLNFFFILCNFLWIFWFKFVEGIVGGEVAYSGQFNYMVSIQEDNKYICNGVIIEKKFIVSAAQCFIGEDDKFKNKKYSITAGTVNLKLQNTNTIKIGVEEIYVPKTFVRVNPNPSKLYYREIGDIAVLKLKLPLILNSAVNIVNVPKRSYSNYLKYYRHKPTLISFGTEAFNRGIKRTREQVEINYNDFDQLKFTETSVAHKNECKSLFPFFFDEKYLCAHVKQHNKKIPEGACFGDIGGPLVLRGDLIAILVQNTQDCDESFYASLYTRITSYIPVINKVLKHEKSKDVRIAVYQNKKYANGTYSEIQDLVEVTPKI